MKKNSIAILFVDDSDCGLTHDYFASVFDSFKRTIEEEGYNLGFINSHFHQKNRPTIVEQVKDKYDGVFVACINYDHPEVQELFSSDIPLVLLDYELEGRVTVSSDNLGGIRSLAKYICEMGHKRIAYIMGDNNCVTQMRRDALLEECRKFGIEIPKEKLFYSKYRDMKKAAYYTEELLRMEEPPSCILYPDDFAAIGGINIIRARGMDIPYDISVAGFDGLNLAMQFEPKLSTVHQDTVTIGQTVGKNLIQLIDDPSSVVPGTILVPTELEKGRTIAKAYY